MIIWKFVAAYSYILLLCNCSQKSYPEQLTGAQRKEYYETYNRSKTAEEWDSISSNTAKVNAVTTERSLTDTIVKQQSQVSESVAFRIKNNNIFPQTLRIADNVLYFNSFELRYIGFPPGTQVYLKRGRKTTDKLLFTVSATDEGKRIKIFN